MNNPSLHILITGGTGLLGNKLSKALLDKGYKLSHLSREPGKDPNIKTFLWDVENKKIDAQCIDDVDIIVHLAGAGIAEKRWTDARKKIIIDSRTHSIRLIYELLKSKTHQVIKVISASGVGYYGDTADALIFEDHGPATDFPGFCCLEWEKAVDDAAALNIPVLKFRTGVVLSPEGGALPQLAAPVKIGLGAAIGSGKQYISWIHIKDAVNMYMYGIENKECTGVFNMVAPHPVTNEEMTKALAKHFKKALWLPNIPGFIMQLLLGEMSTLVVSGTKASSKKIEDTGFNFKFKDLESALEAVYR
jgi:uncharacterized protein (TIGR01777 family)